MTAGRSREEKFPLLFEAAKRSLLAYGMLHKRLMGDLRAIEPIIEQRQGVGERGADPLLSAVAMIDFAHRYGQLIDALPLVNKKQAPIRALEAALVPVEAARHHLQHMRGDLSSEDAIDYPILGSLAWANRDVGFAMAFSHPGASVEGLLWDTQEECFVTSLQYTVKDADIDLNAVHSAMSRTYEWIAAGVPIEPAAVSEFKWGATAAIAMSWRKD